MVDVFRKRFPPPWKIVESWEALVIVDSRGTRLLTVPVSAKPLAVDAAGKSCCLATMD